MDGSIEVFIGKKLEKTNKLQKHKHFVFDLDETIGSFQDLYFLCNMLGFIQEKYKKYAFANFIDIIENLLDLYEEFFRPGIFHIFKYIHLKKKQKLCDGLFIYTNNQCIPETWVKHIVDYMEKKMKIRGLVDNIVRSFKIKNKIVEPRRSTQNKVYNEFIKCVYISNHSDICFIDNTLYPKMKNNSVYYIQPCPYFHSLSINVILNRFFSSSLGKSYLHTLKQPRKTIEQIIVQKYNAEHNGGFMYVSQNNRNYYLDVSKKLMYHIREYLFYKNTKMPKTMKKRKSNKSTTRKCKLL